MATMALSRSAHAAASIQTGGKCTLLVEPGKHPHARDAGPAHVEGAGLAELLDALPDLVRDTVLAGRRGQRVRRQRLGRQRPGRQRLHRESRRRQRDQRQQRDRSAQPRREHAPLNVAPGTDVIVASGGVVLHGRAAAAAPRAGKRRHPCQARPPTGRPRPHGWDRDSPGHRCFTDPTCSACQVLRAARHTSCA
jgi:hypothetical protein